jgi:tRNA threonylcarbamoyladenosine biosynthesis protein TsaB
MFLFIDTTEAEIILALFEDDKLIDQIRKKAQQRQAELLLIILDKFLKKNKINLKQIKGILIVKGPGFFTGTRIGVSTANALSFALDVPILGVKKEKLSLHQIIKKYGQKIKNKKPVLPIYSAPPNITQKKR